MGNSAFGLSAGGGGSIVVKRKIADPTNKWVTARLSTEPLKVYSAPSACQLSATDGNLLVGIQSSTSYVTTPDLVTWTTRTLPASPSYPAFAFGGGVWAYITSTSQYRTTPDGINWTTRTLPANVVGNNSMILQSANGVLFYWNASSTTTYYTSTDGINWTTRTFPTSTSGYGVLYVNGKYFMSFASNLLYTSTDLTSWTACTGATFTYTPNKSLNYFNSTYYLLLGTTDGSGNVFTSTDGVAWSVALTRTGLMFMINALIVGIRQTFFSDYYDGASSVTTYTYSTCLTDIYGADVFDPNLNIGIGGAVYPYASYITMHPMNGITPFKGKYLLNKWSNTTVIFDPTDTYELVIER